MSSRQLSDSETAPDSAPRRYVQSHGYVVLRWKIGPYSYVERREHRQVMIELGHDLRGRHVHHINSIRSDNRPENLEVVSPAQHGLEHRELDHALIVGLYMSGHNVVETARQAGCNPGTVSRILAAAHIKVRKPEPRVLLPNEQVRALYLSGFSPPAIAQTLGMPGHVGAIRRRIREMGLPRRPAGHYADRSKELLQSSTDCA